MGYIKRCALLDHLLFSHVDPPGKTGHPKASLGIGRAVALTDDVFIKQQE